MIRRLKSEVVHNLPCKSRIIRNVAPDQKYVKEITEITKKSGQIDAAIREGSKSNAEIAALKNEQGVLMNSLYRLTGLSKLEAIKAELLTLIEEARVRRVCDQSAAEQALVTRQMDGDLNVRAACNPNIHLGASDETKMMHGAGSHQDLPVSGSSPILIMGDGLIDTASEEEDAKAEISQGSSLRRSQRLSLQGSMQPQRKRLRLGLQSPSLTNHTLVDGSGENIEGCEDDEDVEDGDLDKLLLVGNTQCSQSSSSSSASPAPKSRRIEESDFFVDSPLNGDGGGSLSRKGKAGRVHDDVHADPPSTGSKKAKQRSIYDLMNEVVSRVQTKKKISSLGKKIIVFAHHQCVLDAIVKFLKEINVNHIRVDGKTSQAAKRSLIAQFQEDDLVRRLYKYKHTLRHIGGYFITDFIII